MMAAQLIRNGIHPVVIEAKTQSSQESKALILHARSLEILRQMGLSDVFLQQGKIVTELALHKASDDIETIDLSDLGNGKTAFPFVLIIEQSKTERILIDYLTAHACPIFWNSNLLSIQQNDNNINVRINRNEVEGVFECDWLVGADGAAGRVSQKLNISFHANLHNFYLADLIVPELDQGAIRVFIKDEGFVGLYPLQGDKIRVIGELPKTLQGRVDLTFEDLKPYLVYTLGFSLQNASCTWFSIYPLNQGIADRFRDQRCFLIGDAAHIHSPVLGQGMNTGLQDAYNLAWKMSGVIKNRFDPQILNSYTSEREAAARLLLNTNKTLFSRSNGRFSRKLKNWIFSKGLSSLRKNEDIAPKLFDLVSQTGITYRESKLSVHYSQTKNIRAGDRLPYVKFYDEKLNIETDLHSWCNKTGFTLLVIGKLGQRDLFLLARWIKQAYPFDLNFYYLPPSDKNQHVFDFFEISSTQKKALVVRPDLHIGYLSDAVVIEMVDNYLKGVIGFNV
jgi:2-polyprenyl-6-methoxyphenol hydroxylase-like FAD-dependent oxidoreductase